MGILLDLRKDVSSDIQKKLFAFYDDLDLKKEAFLRLKNWQWEIISKGILELTQMQVKEACSFIVKFINDSRGAIRKQAEIAAVSLQPGAINYFLDTMTYKISEWQQLKLLDVLRNKEDFNTPNFSVGLTSSNKHVVPFALRLIKFYNQNDANGAIIELVKHKDEHVRRQAIDCLKDFYVTESKPTLIGIFKKSSVNTKISILGAIAGLGDTQDIEFLLSTSIKEGNFSVRNKAIAAVNTIALHSILSKENIERVADYEIANFSGDIEEPERTENSRETSQFENNIQISIPKVHPPQIKIFNYPQNLPLCQKKTKTTRL